MRFLHTSDWHLGRIFHGFHLLEDQRAALNQIITLARDYKVDALLVAGDIYDRAVPPTEAVNLLDETLRRLVMDLKLPVILIAGNHDNPDRLNFGRTLFATRSCTLWVRWRRTPLPLCWRTQPALSTSPPCPTVNP